MMIASHAEGRLRVRVGESGESSLLENVRASLLNLDGVREAEANFKTGSLLIFYDPSPRVKERVLHTLTPYLDEPGKGSPSKVRTLLSAASPHLPDRRRVVHWGMLSSLGVSLVGAALDAKKFHILTGIVFVVFLGIHLSGKKRVLFPKRKGRRNQSCCHIHSSPKPAV